MTLLVEILDWPEDLPVSGSLISFLGGWGGGGVGGVCVGESGVGCVVERRKAN